MILLKKEMSIKQEEEVVQPVVKEEPHEADAQRRLCTKRLTRNAYMKKYRAHQRLLPTYAVLTRFRSPIKFSTSSGIRCNAEIVNGDLHVRLHYDTSLCEDNISFLPACPIEARKIVAGAVIKAYKN